MASKWEPVSRVVQFKNRPIANQMGRFLASHPFQEAILFRFLYKVHAYSPLLSQDAEGLGPMIFTKGQECLIGKRKRSVCC